MTNIFGRLFNGVSQRTDASRIEALMPRMYGTPAGRKLLSYMKEQNLQVTFRHDMHAFIESEQGPSGIVLNPNRPDDNLLGVLAAAVRERKLREEEPSPAIIPAGAQIDIDRLKLADKFSFQMKFVEDHARITGDAGPLYHTFSPEVRQTLAGKTDAARFGAWNDILKAGDQDRFETWRFYAKSRAEGREYFSTLPILPASEEPRIVFNTIAAYDNVWPYPEQDGRSSYLRAETVEEALQLVRSPLRDDPAMAPAFQEAGAVHDNLLQRQEEELGSRLDALKERFGRSKAGRALLQFAEDNGVDIRFEPALLPRDAGGRTHRKTNAVELNMHLPDDNLIATLAHELRHVIQNKAAPVPEVILSPDASIALERFREADAFTFGRKFVEDYARETGDDRPLRASQPDRLTAARTPLSDLGGFLHENMRLASDYRDSTLYGQYEAGAYRTWERCAAAQDKEGRWPVLSTAESNKVLINSARACDNVWPLDPKGGGQRYLSTLSDDDILEAAKNMMRHDPEMDDKLKASDAKYFRLLTQYQAGRTAPSGSAGKAPSL